MSAQLALFRPDDGRPDDRPAPPDAASPGGHRGRPILTIREVVDLYLPHKERTNHCEAAMVERRRVLLLLCAWEHRTGCRFGDLPATEAIPADLEDWIEANPDWPAVNTKNRIAAYIKAAFSWAAKGRRIPLNPFSGVHFGKGFKGRDLERSELVALLKLASPYFRRLIRFLIFTGCRPGEARALLWSQINEDLRAAIQEKHKTRHTSSETKDRKIVLTKRVLRILKWLRRHRQFCFSWMHEERGGDFVFLNSKGRPWTGTAICKHLRELRRRAGLPEDVKLHGCRHYFGTQAVLNAEKPDLAALAELMGHEGIGTTMGYVHLANKTDHLHAAAEQATSRRRR